MAPTLLLVSSSLDSLLFLKHVLETDGFEIVLAADFTTASEQASLVKPAAIIADCGVSNTTCRDLCVDLKNASATKSIVFIPLIEPGADLLHIGMIQAGADRCFHRPFEPVELLEYLRVRFMDSGPSKNQILKGGGIELDIRARRAHRDGTVLKLGMLDFNLLQLFMEKPGKVMRRNELIAGGWPANTFVDDRTVDVRIGLLRKALRLTDGNDPIRTVRGIGYVFDAELPPSTNDAT